MDSNWTDYVLGGTLVVLCAIAFWLIVVKRVGRD